MARTTRSALVPSEIVPMVVPAMMDTTSVDGVHSSDSVSVHVSLKACGFTASTTISIGPTVRKSGLSLQPAEPMSEASSWPGFG